MDVVYEHEGASVGKGVKKEREREGEEEEEWVAMDMDVRLFPFPTLLITYAFLDVISPATLATRTSSTLSQTVPSTNADDVYICISSIVHRELEVLESPCFGFHFVHEPFVIRLQVSSFRYPMGPSSSILFWFFF